MSAWRAIVGIVGAAFLSGVAAALGPEDTVICGRGHILDRAAQAFMERLGAGHIDGPTATYCVVPSTAAWILAAAVFLSVAIAGLLLARRDQGEALDPGSRSIDAQ
jgi:hypothetical protein